MKHTHSTKRTALFASIALLTAAHVSADPAMSVVTLHTPDPMAYMDWAMKSGPAIGDAIDAELGGICLSTAGFFGPGEMYYWHVFEDHADAMSASIYDEAVTAETAKLSVERRVAGADLYTVAMASPREWKAGDSFANWNIVISTDEPGLYMQQLSRILDAAGKNGFDDVFLNAYATLTGPMAGNMLVAVSAPDSARLGAFLDEMNSAWMGPIMAELAGIRAYEHGFAMQCTVVYVDD
jgi:hypothetical protein